MQSLHLLPPGPTLLALGCSGAATPTGSVCVLGSQPFQVLKSPLAKFDNISATHPEASADSHGTAVDGREEEVASLLRPTPPALPVPAVPALPQHAQPAAWLMGLFATDLFSACPHHPTLRKNECNQYCLLCTHTQPRGMCKYCLPGHAHCGGRTWQIRKYMYQTCIHVEDIQPHYDVSGVQAYCINSKRAVLIHPKQMAPGMACPAFDNTCAGCAKPLRNDCTYCSLRCKVDVHFGLQPATPRSCSAAGGLPRAGPPAARAPGAAAQPAAAQAALPAAAAAVAAAAGAEAPLGKRAAALKALRPPSAESDVSGRSSASQCSLGSKKRRKLDRPQRSFLS